MSRQHHVVGAGAHRLLGLGADPREPVLQRVRRPGSKVQSISTAASPNCRTIAAKRAFDTNGLSSCRISVWLLSSSSTFLRLPNRVFRLITRCSRKRVDRRVGHLAEVLPEVVAERPVARRQHRGRRVVAHRADRLLAVLGHRRAARSRAPRPSSRPRSAAAAARRPRRAAAPRRRSSRSSRSVIEPTHSPNGWLAAIRSLISASW